MTPADPQRAPRVSDETSGEELDRFIAAQALGYTIGGPKHLRRRAGLSLRAARARIATLEAENARLQKLVEQKP